MLLKVYSQNRHIVQIIGDGNRKTYSINFPLNSIRAAERTHVNEIRIMQTRASKAYYFYIEHLPKYIAYQVILPGVGLL